MLAVMGFVYFVVLYILFAVLHYYRRDNRTSNVSESILYVICYLLLIKGQETQKPEICNIFRPGNGSPSATNVVLLLVRPPVYGSNGRSYKMLVMFFFFLFRHAFSEVSRPIALKLGHMVGKCLNFIIQVQKFGGPSAKKIWGQKHAKFRSILYNFRLRSRISPE